jgi:hypothetical protein
MCRGIKESLVEIVYQGDDCFIPDVGDVWHGKTINMPENKANDLINRGLAMASAPEYTIEED